MCNPLVSVIIPVYNREEYIENTIKSVLDNNYSNIEIICIDDGSSDNSLEIIKKLADNNNNIKYYPQANSGVSNARNNGLQKAIGKYVLFLDSDDLIRKDTIHTCVKYLEQNNADIICFNMLVREFSQKEFICFHSTYFDNYLTACYAKDYPKAVNFTNAAPSLIKKDFIVKWNISFLPNRIYEDWIFMVEIFSKNPYCVFLNEPMYIYNRTLTESITRKIDKSCLDIFNSYRVSNDIILNCSLNSYWANVNDLKITKDAANFLLFNLIKCQNNDICNEFAKELRKILLQFNPIYLEFMTQFESIKVRDTIKYILKNEKFKRQGLKKYLHLQNLKRSVASFFSNLVAYCYYLFLGIFEK